MYSDSLPQPLLISHTLGDNGTKYNTGNHRNLAVVQWSEFIANDLNKPVVTTMSKLLKVIIYFWILNVICPRIFNFYAKH